MIIKQEHKDLGKLPFSMGRRTIFALLGVSLILVLLTYIPRSSKEVAVQDGVYCGAEELVFDGTNTLFQGEGALFSNAESQSDEYARTGSYSSKTDKDQAYGMFLMLKNAQAGEVYRASIWKYGNKLEAGRLVVSIDNPEGDPFYKQVDQAVEIDEGEWEKLEITFRVPDYYQNQGIRIYPLGGESPLYFDDFLIQKLPAFSWTEGQHIDSSILSLKLKIDDNNYDFLKARRQEILSTGIYFAKEKDWVKARIVDTLDEIPAKLRFKGDWMDHIKFDKWSFRIRMKAPHAWNRFTTFSIQRPENRSFLREWVYHKFLDQEDVLSPRYDFVQVSINGEEKGIYGLEEHFEKILPEFRARREGPILKFSEDGVWNARKRSLDMDLPGKPIEEQLKSFEASQILPFQEGKILANPKLKEQFLDAQKLLLQFKEGQKGVSEIFDLEKLAKYYAITDICQAFHSSIWHNQRFYFNPVLSKLEPIAYDGYTESGIFRLGGGQPMLGSAKGDRIANAENDLMFRAMEDSAFVRRYHQYLDAFTQEDYLDEFILDIQPQLEGKIYRLSQEFKNYNYNINQLKEQARKIRSILFPLDNNSIRVFRVKEGDKTVLRIKNYHHLPLEITALAKGKKIQEVLSHFIKPFDREKLPQIQEVEIEQEGDILFFRLPGLAHVYQSNVLPWSEGEEEIPSQELFSSRDVAEHEAYEIEGKKIRFSGKHKIDEDILIPAAYQVIFQAGSELDFVNNASFISYSAVQILGEAENPVRIFSSDKSAGGFSVFQAKAKSHIQYASFEDFGTLEKESWKLTGALSFYESDLEMTFSSIRNNYSEDALNLIRSEFRIENCLIQETFADGLDVDFCKGEILKLTCRNTGNDAVDLSGSRVNLYQLDVLNPGDKGISVGEESFVIVYSAKIEGAKIGLASKDLSVAEVKNMEIKNCNIAFSAYQKKPEFGPAKILVDTLETEGINYLHLIEKASELRLKGKLAETL